MLFSTLLAEVDIGKAFPPADKFGSIGSLVSLLSRVVGLGGALLVVASIVFTAYLYLSSGGEAKNIEKAKGMLTGTVIGMVVIATAYWITQIIAKFLGGEF